MQLVVPSAVSAAVSAATAMRITTSQMLFFSMIFYPFTFLPFSLLVVRPATFTWSRGVVAATVVAGVAGLAGA